MPSSPAPSAPPKAGEIPRRLARTPADALALIPHLLGFRPSPGDLVILGTVRTDGSPAARVRLTLRYDLPGQPDAAVRADLVNHATAVLVANDCGAMTAVGYGPDDQVSPLVRMLRIAAASRGLNLAGFFRVQDQRYWSCLCRDPDCCPPAGTEFGARPDGIPGGGQVFASRDALAASLAPVTGEDAESMRAATRRARARAARHAKAGGEDAVRAAGLDAVADAISTYRDGGRFTAHDEPAWLALALKDLRVRDDAWVRSDPGHRREHLRLWTDLTRLARRGYAAPAASLLAFTAWQDGNGALANIALDRALGDDPYYQMANLLRRAIGSGAPPSLARVPMSPEDVAAVYDEQDRAFVPA